MYIHKVLCLPLLRDYDQHVYIHSYYFCFHQERLLMEAVWKIKHLLLSCLKDCLLRFVAAKNRVSGFVRMLTSTFSLVMISLSSDTITFWFSLAIAIVDGTARQNLADSYAQIFNKFCQLKMSSCYTGMVSYRKKIKISHVLNFRNI